MCNHRLTAKVAIRAARWRRCLGGGLGARASLSPVGAPPLPAPRCVAQLRSSLSPALGGFREFPCLIKLLAAGEELRPPQAPTPTVGGWTWRWLIALAPPAVPSLAQTDCG